MPTKKTLQVVLTPRQQQFVSRRVAAGEYQSPQEVIRAGIGALERESTDFEAAIDEVRAKIAEGIADLRAGRSVDGETAMKRIRKKLASRARGRKR